MPPRNPLSVRLVEEGGKKRCSMCGHVFPSDVGLNIGQAFADHVFAEHKRTKGMPGKVEKSQRNDIRNNRRK